MAKEKGASQTQKPTPKRVKDARKDGDVHKSQELSSTVQLLFALLLAWLFAAIAGEQLQLLFTAVLDGLDQPFEDQLRTLTWTALKALLFVMGPVLLTLAVFGAAIEFLQVGPLFAIKRITPKMSHLNPAEGIKRMFTQRNVVEVVKALIKTLFLLAIAAAVIYTILDDYLELSHTDATVIGPAYWHGLSRIALWILFVFFFRFRGGRCVSTLLLPA